MAESGVLRARASPTPSPAQFISEIWLFGELVRGLYCFSTSLARQELGSPEPSKQRRATCVERTIWRDFQGSFGVGTDYLTRLWLLARGIELFHCQDAHISSSGTGYTALQVAVGYAQHLGRGAVPENRRTCRRALK